MKPVADICATRRRLIVFDREIYPARKINKEDEEEDEEEGNQGEYDDTIALV